jgi:hypothetical protein
VQEHGYGVDPPSQLIGFLNPEDADEVASFKTGETNNNTVIAKRDFIPSAGAPPYLLAQATIQGKIAPPEYNGLRIDGSYGPLWIVRTQYIQQGWFCVLATSGANSPDNAISVRQHVNPTYQGLAYDPWKCSGLSHSRFFLDTHNWRWN